MENRVKKLLRYFSRTEWAIWLSSVALIAVSFAVFDRENYLTLCASLIGATSLIFNAKGNPIGQALTIIFSILYGIISYTFAYYGEMITYLGMTMPMAIFALISWLRNPYKGNRAQVKVNSLKAKEILLMLAAAALITLAFYIILEACGTANMIPSTISVTTSFIAVYLTFRRSPLCARIRRQRHRADRAVDTRHDRGYDLSVCRDLLCDVPDQRYIRICQLAQNAKKAGD